MFSAQMEFIKNLVPDSKIKDDILNYFPRDEIPLGGVVVATHCTTLPHSVCSIMLETLYCTFTAESVVWPFTHNL